MPPAVNCATISVAATQRFRHRRGPPAGCDSSVAQSQGPSCCRVSTSRHILVNLPLTPPVMPVCCRGHLTYLMTDGCPGLQIHHQGAWHNVPHVPGGYSGVKSACDAAACGRSCVPHAVQWVQCTTVVLGASRHSSATWSLGNTKAGAGGWHRFAGGLTSV